ncbi:hypothetical protein GCM10027429_15130 [Marivirga atlantica]|jgi:hypothetical protein|uniref:Ribbon-helix-helix domain-containing protein n=1 Tax=Marivirga atlantica TaxID=1548457 RepID=A0A937AGG9_9BACT|nr:ribbon-helix-helix domain-containing protein [Marivirga atlantica]MBL0765129.1 ribbon-helix-helix domain-containing protein [Marivirga atlantica]
MTTLTTSIPDQLVELLSAKAKELNMPKNKLIEKALSLYLEHLERAAYAKSYQRASEDADVMLMAEEGMTEYLKQLKEDEAG